MRASYRSWPAVVLAVTGAVAAAVYICAPSASLAGQGCTEGRQWVAMVPAAPASIAPNAALADYKQHLVPVLSGCVDLSRLTPVDPADRPDERS